MTKAELFEHVRTLLRDAQSVISINPPQVYSDDELTLYVRSALRHVKALGVSTDTVMSTLGALAPDPTDSVGILLALRVVVSLLRGDMIHRVTTGQFGIVFSMGNDTIDTKTAAIQFKDSSDEFEEEFRTLMTIIMSAEIDKQDVFGGPKAPGRLN